MRPMEPTIRTASCAAPISIENTATGSPSFSATCSAMLMANAVLPIDGRAASTTRSPACRPAVMRSRSMKPVGTPVTSFGLSAISCTRSSSCTTRLSMAWKPCFMREPSSPILKILPSASSRILSTARPCGLKALVAISSLALTSLRRIERSRTISA